MVVVIGVKVLLEIWFTIDEPNLIFIAAVMVSAYIGGLGPGLFATALIVVANTYFFAVPVHTLRVHSVSDAVNVALLFIEGSALSVAFHGLRKRLRSELRLRKKHEIFVANIVHELRSPLNAMMGWSWIMLRDPRRQEEGLQVMQRNLKLQQRLVEELLDFSRMIHGKAELIPSRFNFSTIVDEAIKSVEPEAGKKGLRLVTHVRPGIEITGDEARLYQVLINLLGNAIKYTEAGRITVMLREHDEWVEFSVGDTGRGILASSLPNLFDRFWREKREQGESGLGIGLWVVRYIVALHSGSVHVASGGENRGALFTVLLPKQ